MTGAGRDELGRLVLTAHGDAWAEQGDLRVPWGGATAELPGIRLMRSGLPHPQWNNGDVHDAERVDVDAVRAWYAEADVPWGVRVPADTAWRVGRHLFRKRAMGLRADQWTPAEGPPGVRLRTATRADLDAVVEVDATAFGDPVEQNRPWVEPHLSSARCRVVVAEADGAVVGCATGTYSERWAGPAVMVTGVAVAEQYRRRGVGAALTSDLVAWAFRSGAGLVHLNPDDDPAARLYSRLGFVEVPGFDVYVEL